MTKNLPSGGAQLIENESVEQKATAKDTAQTYEAEELPSKPLKQPIKSESAVKREDTFLPPAPKISVPDSRITNKENQFGRENSELQPPPPTFSDSYFDMDETDLAQLDGMDNSEGVNNTLGGNTSISEDSCMITEASIRMSSSVCGGIHQVGSSKILNGDLKKPQNSEGLRFLKEFNEKLPDGLNEARPQSGSGWQNITNLQNNQFNSLGCGRFNGSAANFPVKGLPGIRGSSMILKDETGSFKTPTPLKPPQTNTRPLHEPFSRFSALRTNESK
ncbi:hypothetical protein BY996DRAFT_3181244 [Phakopsora pachyrhizi]|nr:hypothetical protein BY996DRAFT_3181244 [Phakopsora pachyrhizi]